MRVPSSFRLASINQFERGYRGPARTAPCRSNRRRSTRLSRVAFCLWAPRPQTLLARSERCKARSAQKMPEDRCDWLGALIAHEAVRARPRYPRSNWLVLANRDEGCAHKEPSRAATLTHITRARAPRCRSDAPKANHTAPSTNRRIVPFHAMDNAPVAHDRSCVLYGSVHSPLIARTRTDYPEPHLSSVPKASCGNS